MVVPGAGVAGAVVSTIVAVEGSRCAWPLPRQETTIIVLAAIAATLDATTVQNSF